MSIQSTNWHPSIAGCIVGLTCVPITKGCSSVQNLEFPLFLNALAASPIRAAVEKGGLPHGTHSYENAFSSCEVCFEEAVISSDHEFFISCIRWSHIVHGHCCERSA